MMSSMILVMFIRLGPQQKCEQLTKVGHVQYEAGTVPRGCYSSHILLGPGTALVRLPPALTTELATPVNCALATMVAARRVARHALDIERTVNMETREQRSVIIYGAGLLGLYGCALFKEDGFKVRFMVAYVCLKSEINKPGLRQRSCSGASQAGRQFWS